MRRNVGKHPLIGKKFGRLTVLSYVGRDKWGHQNFECICDCGNKKYASGTFKILKKGPRSCGCLLEDRNFKNLVGEKFGKLTVLKRVEKHKTAKEKRRRWLCRCECGNETIVTENNLKSSDDVSSCGCSLQIALKSLHENNIKHQMCATYTYIAWAEMRQKCHNPLYKGFKGYGSLGIKICREWTEFGNFFSDMGERQPKTYLNRYNINKDFSKENCFWSSKRQCIK